MTDQELDRLIAKVDGSQVSRRGFLAASGFASMAAFIAACSGGASSAAPSAAAPSAAASAAPSAAASVDASAAASAGPAGGTGTTEGAFYLYNWADYTDLGNIETFKTNYGITDWVYDIFASNDEMITTLQGGKVGQWDVSAPTADLVPTLLAGDFIQKIDWSKVPNIKNLNPAFTKQWWDPTGEYSMAKDWGTTGITVRTKDVKEPVNTWKAFFDLAPQYSGRVIAVNSQVDIFGSALKALGYSLNTEDSAQLEEMRQLLLGWAPHLLGLNSDTYEVPIGNEEAVLGLTWTGGVSDLRKAPETADTQYIIPDDGVLYWVDTWVLLKDAPHPEAAHAWLNFMADPQINAIDTETNQYATPNDAALEYISPELLADTTIFIPEETIKAGVDSGKWEVSKDWSGSTQRSDIWAEFSAKVGGYPSQTGTGSCPMAGVTAPAPKPAPEAKASGRFRSGLLTALLILPAGLWYLILLVAPLAIVILFSFGHRGATGGYGGGFTLDNYQGVLKQPDPLLTSLFLATTGTILCLLIGLPLAYYIATRAGTRKSLYLILLVIPFWTSFLIRTYAWLMILGPDGAAGFIGDLLGNPSFRILGTEQAVLMGLVYGYLPLMVFPLYVSLERMDRSLVEASKDLGAGRWATFRQITLPVMMPGLVSGSILVFIPMMGEYVIPQILGYGQVFTMGNALVLRFLESRNWPSGAAMAVALILVMLVAISLYLWYLGRGRRDREVSML